MSKLTAVIAVASGSCDVDVIVTASHLRQLGIKVLIASVEGWSPVTLRNGLVVKPHCSVDRLFYSRGSRPFDFLLLPDGDDISYGRLQSHPQLAVAVRNLLGTESTSKSVKLHSNDTTPCIVFAGISIKLHRYWLPHNKNSRIRSIKNWFISKASGSQIILQEHGQSANAVLCCGASSESPVETADTCASIAHKLIQSKARNDMKAKMGNLKSSAIQTRINRNRPKPVASQLRLLTYLRDCTWIPSGLRAFVLSPVCSLFAEENKPSTYYPSGLYPGLSLDEGDQLKKVHFDRTSLGIGSKSAACVIEKIKRFIGKSLDLDRRPLPMCSAAILVCNRVDEQLLAVLVHSLSSKFKLMTHVIACDRALLQTRDPFVITRGMLQIRADNNIETAKPFYDVVIAIDSEVVGGGPGIWYRKSTFDYGDFEIIRKGKLPPHVSCVAAKFEAGDKCAGIMQSVTDKRLNPLTNEWITLETSSDTGIEKKTPDTTFFDVCHDIGRSKTGLWKADNNHSLLFQTFRSFHSGSALHTSVSSRSSAHDAMDFSRAVTDCLRKVMMKNGQQLESVPQYSRCIVM